MFSIVDSLRKLVMTYLDSINRLIKDSNLTLEEGINLREFTDPLVMNRQSFPTEIPDKYKHVIQKITEQGFLSQLEDILTRSIDFDNTDLDDDVAGIH